MTRTLLTFSLIYMLNKRLKRELKLKKESLKDFHMFKIKQISRMHRQFAEFVSESSELTLSFLKHLSHQSKDLVSAAF